MTDMQLEYNKYRELVRHDKAMEQQQAAELAETVRSHGANESIKRDELAETVRHQIAMDTETLRAHQVGEAEIAKHNRATEALAYAEQGLRERLNDAQIAANEMIAKWNNATTLERQRMVNNTNTKLATLTNGLQRDIAKMEDARKGQQIELNGQYYELEKDNLKRVNERADFNATQEAEYKAKMARAALQNAQTAANQYELAEEMSTSEKVKNYAQSVGSVLSGAGSLLKGLNPIAGAVGSAFPKAKSAGGSSTKEVVDEQAWRPATSQWTDTDPNAKYKMNPNITFTVKEED